MSLCACTCTCHNSDKIARSVLNRAEVYGYDFCPINRGRKNSMEQLDILQDKGCDVSEVRKYILDHSAFVIFIGYVDGCSKIEWVNAGDGKLEHRLQAVELAKSFAP